MIPKAIILIGPDKAGKSTLTTSLLKHYPDMGYRKGLYIPKFEDMKIAIEAELKKLNRRIYPKIYDRFHFPDELIYGELNRKDPISEDKKKWFNLYVASELERIGTLFVYCYADLKDLEKRFIASGETDIKVEWLKQLQEKYHEWASTQMRRKFMRVDLNSSELTKEEMLERTIYAIELHK